jgi:hypothetical protein
MSRLYSLIENSVVNVLRLIINNQDEQQQASWIIRNANLLVGIISAFAFVMVVFLAGLFLWNRGLAPVFTFIKPLGMIESVRQFDNPYTQLLVTLIAMMVVL